MESSRPVARAQAFREPPARTPLQAEPPLPAERQFARRSFELQASFGLGHKLCPAGVQSCTGAPGLAFGASAWARPSPYFAWGLALDHTRFDQALEVPGADVRLATGATSLTLNGRALPAGTGSFDPYVELGFGGGRYGETGEVRLPDASAFEVEAVSWAPLLAVGAGVRVHAGSALELGAEFGWQHWLLSSAERCAGVAFGVCTLPSYGHFDVSNAVWRWQLDATFLFGAPH
jgi:hypothetical protein